MRYSILTPTMNRPEFVARALRYYAATGYHGCVLLGDSSGPEAQAAIHRAIEEVSGQLQVEYYYFPPEQYQGSTGVMRALSERASTPYVVYAGDDDLLTPNALDASADFLENHPDYTAAHGKGFAFQLDASGPYGAIIHTHPIPGHHVTSDSAAERWRAYMRLTLSTQYYLHRRETWLEMYRQAIGAPQRYLGEEVLPCSYTLLLGKVAELDCLAYAFQLNDARPFGWDTHSLYSLTMQPEWTPTVTTLRRHITATLMERDGLAEAAAQRIFDEELWRHLLIMLQAHYDQRYPTTNRFSAFKQRFPWLVRLVQTVRRRRVRHYQPLTLPALCNPQHPYHADFVRIRAALAGRQPA